MKCFKTQNRFRSASAVFINHFLMKLTNLTYSPLFSRAVAITPGDGLNHVSKLRAGMRIVLKFYSDDKHNDEPRWALIKRIELTHATIAKLSLQLNTACEQPDGDGIFMTRDIDNFYICNRQHGTHWCVYTAVGEDANANEAAMNREVEEETFLVETISRRGQPRACKSKTK